MSPDLYLDRQQRLGADRLRDRRRQRERLLVSQLFSAEMPQQLTARVREARGRAEQLDRLASVWADHVGLLLQHRQRLLDAGDPPHAREQLLVKALRAARLQLQLHVAHEIAAQLRDGVVEAGARHLGGEQQRHAHRQPQHREQLLDEHPPHT